MYSVASKDRNELEVRVVLICINSRMPLAVVYQTIGSYRYNRVWHYVSRDEEPLFKRDTLRDLSRIACSSSSIFSSTSVMTLSLWQLAFEFTYRPYLWPFQADACTNSDYTRCFNTESKAKDVIRWSDFFTFCFKLLNTIRHFMYWRLIYKQDIGSILYIESSILNP